MEFSDVASFFDDDSVYDAYTGAFLFLAHTTAHDDHTSSGATARRRTLTTEPGTSPPTRRVISWYGTFWLVGNNNTDAFEGSEVRRSYGLKKSTGSMALLTPAQACTSAAGTAFYAHREYYRDMTDQRTSADYDVMWNVFCPFNEAVVKGSFLREGSVIYRVRNAYPSVDEFVIAESDQFDADALQTAVFVANSALDLTSDSMSTISTTVPVIQTDVSDYYTFHTAAESDILPGDRTVFVAKSAITPIVGADFTMLSATWRVLTIASENDSWALRARLT